MKCIIKTPDVEIVYKHKRNGKRHGYYKAFQWVKGQKKLVQHLIYKNDEVVKVVK